MATTLPKITTKISGIGWLTACPACGWEKWTERRPAADRAAADHLTAHAAKGATR